MFSLGMLTINGYDLIDLIEVYYLSINRMPSVIRQADDRNQHICLSGITWYECFDNILYNMTFLYLVIMSYQGCQPII